MEPGGLILKRFLQYSKLIALFAAVFLLAAKLDKVPDCPELVNSNSAAPVSLQLVHHDAAAATCNAIRFALDLLRPSAIDTHYAIDAFFVIAPSWVIRSLHQSADPSPPVL